MLLAMFSIFICLIVLSTRNISSFYKKKFINQREVYLITLSCEENWQFEIQVSLELNLFPFIICNEVFRNSPQKEYLSVIVEGEEISKQRNNKRGEKCTDG